MAHFLVGAISDELGLASSWEAVESRHASRSFDVRRTFWACPSSKFRMVQPADLPLEAGHHGPRLGNVEHLELRKDKRLWIVAEVRDGFDLTRQDWQLSYDLIEKSDGYRLQAVAVVERSATTCLPTIEVRDGQVYQCVRQVSSLDDSTVAELLRHAEKTQKTRRGGLLLIHDVEREKRLEAENRYYDWLPLNPMPQRQQMIPPQGRPGWRPGGIEWSQTPGRVLSVR